MSTILKIIWVVVVAIFLNACSKKPDAIKIVDGPANGVGYAIETHLNGPLVADYTEVYAVGENVAGGKRLILSGDYLEVKISFVDKTNANICIGEGSANVFVNQFLIKNNGKTETMKNHLLERC